MPLGSGREILALVVAALFAVPAFAPGPPEVTSSLILADMRPGGGEIFDGGTVQNVSWNGTHDADDWMWAEASASLGGTASFITAGEFPMRNASWSWQVPRFNTTTARATLCGAAPDGDRACVTSGADFVIRAASPYLDLLSPANGSENVPRNASLVFGFEGIDTSSLYWIIMPSIPFTPVWGPDPRVLTLVPSTPFPACGPFSISAGAQDSGGNPVGPYQWRFTIACPPEWLNVYAGTQILLEFSKAMDPKAFAYSISPHADFSVRWTIRNRIVTLTPSSPFTPCTLYTFSFSAADFQGNVVVPGPNPNPFSFTTSCGPYIVRTEPADGDAGVWFWDPIIVEFSEPIDVTKLFALRLSPPISGGTYTFSGGDKILRFDHIEPFAGCTEYTALVDYPDLIPGPVPNPWRFRTACVPPVVTSITKMEPDTVRIMWFQEWTSPDVYRVYDSPDRFAPWPWRLLGELPAGSILFDAGGHLTDGETHFYTVAGVYGVIESRSQMVVKAELDFGFSDSRTNLYDVGLPFRSQFTAPIHATDVTPDLTDSEPGSPVDILGTWDPVTRMTHYYFHFRGAWRGADFPIYPGQGLWLGTTRPFRWTILGGDANVTLTFNAELEYRISLPYTSPCRTASDVVLELEGSLGPAANTRIVDLAIWDSAQALQRFSWSPSGWTGADFAIDPGDAIRLWTVASFMWNPRLLGAP